MTAVFMSVDVPREPFISSDPVGTLSAFLPASGGVRVVVGDDSPGRASVTAGRTLDHATARAFAEWLLANLPEPAKAAE